MMTKRILQLSLAVIMGLLVVAMPVYAVNVNNAAYIADIVTINSGTSTLTNVATVMPINTQALIDGKYITPDLENVALQTPEGVDILYMPGLGDSPWVFFVPSISASEQKCYSFYAGGPPMSAETVYFPKTEGEVTGMTVLDSDSLELGGNFKVEFQGYVDTSAGENKNLVFNDLAFKIWVSGAEGKEISASIYQDEGEWDACKVTAPNVLSGLHWIEVTANTQYLKIYVDGGEKDSEYLGGTISVPEITHTWKFMENGSMLYMEVLKIWVGSD